MYTLVFDYYAKQSRCGCGGYVFREERDIRGDNIYCVECGEFGGQIDDSYSQIRVERDGSTWQH